MLVNYSLRMQSTVKYTLLSLTIILRLVNYSFTIVTLYISETFKLCFGTTIVNFLLIIHVVYTSKT